MPIRFCKLMRGFGGDTRGSVIVLFAVALVPMLLATGVAVDYARGQLFKSQLQGAVDSAALAGAAAYVDSTSATTAKTVATANLNAAISHLPSYNGNVAISATPGTGTTSGGSPAYTMVVTASAAIPNSLMSMVSSATTISASATAINPQVTQKSNLGNFSSSAWDNNKIYWYLVPSDGSAPALSTFSNNLIYNNAPGFNNSKPSVPTVQASQKVGYALVNTTGGNQSYGNNQYGGKPGSVHIFYSHLTIPSSVAYPTIHQNCSLQVLAGSPSTAPSGSCSTATPANSAPSCSSLGGNTYKFFWNDMGGGTDDKDYNDGEYTVSCAPSSGGGAGSGPTTVVLVQ